MKRINHPFFDCLDEIQKLNTWSAYAGVPFPKAKFLKALKQAHPFVFDKKTTTAAISYAGHVGKAWTVEEAMEKAGLLDDSLSELQTEISDRASKVEEFSLPFKTSLYLLSEIDTVVARPSPTPGGDPIFLKRAGYLINEVTPEKIEVYDLATLYIDSLKRFIPAIEYMLIDLNSFEENLSSDILSINRFTDMISVKRIGIEHRGIRNFKDKSHGVISIKYPNIIMWLIK